MGRFDSRWVFGALVALAVGNLGCAYWDGDRRVGAAEVKGWNVVVKLDDAGELDYLFLSAPDGSTLTEKYNIRVGPDVQGRDSVRIYRKVD